MQEFCGQAALRAYEETRPPKKRNERIGQLLMMVANVVPRPPRTEMVKQKRPN